MSIMIRDCERCGHEWPQRGEKKPKQCPNCRSPYWSVPLLKACYDKNTGLWYVAQYSNETGWFVSETGYPDRKSAQEAVEEIRKEAAAEP